LNQPRLRILIVDDAGPVVVLCVNVLQALGYAVKGANRGETAVELLTGFDVYHQAKTLHPELAVVLVTGHGSPEVVTEANRLGFDSILLKPFTSEELRGTVEKVLTDRKQDSR